MISSEIFPPKSREDSLFESGKPVKKIDGLFYERDVYQLNFHYIIPLTIFSLSLSRIIYDSGRSFQQIAQFYIAAFADDISRNLENAH